MTNLADLLPAGGGQNNTDFVADGNVSAGAPVILTAAGKAAEVTISSTSFSENVGTEAQFTSSDADKQKMAYTESGKVVIIYTDAGNSSYGTAVVGTVSGNTISYGTPVVYTSTSMAQSDCVYDTTNQKLVIHYMEATTLTGQAVVGTISGTSISFGTKVQFSANNVSYISSAFDTVAGKTVTAYAHSLNGYAIVGTVSGTSISFGSEATVRSGQTTEFATVYDTNADKTVILYRESNIAGAGEGVVGTVSGTSISFGTAVQFDSAPVTVVVGAYDSSSNQVICAYTKVHAKVVLGTVSGTSISFGAIVTAPTTESAEYNAVAYDSNVNKIVLVASEYGVDGTIATGTVSGTSLSFASPATEFNPSDISNWNAVAYDSFNKKVVLSYVKNNASGQALVFQAAGTAQVPNLTSTNLLGLAPEAISDTATGTINTWGSRNEAAFAALATGSTTDLTGKTQSPYPDITYDITQGKFVVFFEDGNNSNYGTAVVATVSGSTVSFGTPVVFNSGTTIALGATYSEANGRHVVVYPNYSDSQKATAAVGTVSGTSISFGTPVVFDSTITNTQCSVAYNSTLGKYLAGAMTSTIKVTVLTVDPSDNSVTFGTPVSLTGTRYYPNIVSNESASDFVLTNAVNDNQAEAHLISVSGTTPTVEDTETISSVVSTSYPRTGLVFLESNKFVCVTSENNTNNMYTRTITVSGTSLSIGTQSAAFTVDPDNQTTINGRWPLFFVSTTEAYLYYADDTSNYLKYVPITISGTTATSGAELTYHSTFVSYAGFGYNSSTKQSLSFFQDGSQTKGLAQNGALVIGTKYYVTTSGGFSSSADTPSVNAGLAISTTSLLLNGDS